MIIGSLGSANWGLRFDEALFRRELPKMPQAAKKICTHPGCYTITTESRCEKHRAQQHRGTTKNRSGDPFYGTAAWKRIREARRRANPLCQECEGKGLVRAMHAVDHIKARCDYPELELDYDNTQSLCETCHNSKTARERKR